MSDTHHWKEIQRNQKMVFNNNKGKKKKKKKRSPMATAVQDENRKIISTGSFWKLKLKKKHYGGVGVNQFNTH